MTSKCQGASVLVQPLSNYSYTSSDVFRMPKPKLLFRFFHVVYIHAYECLYVYIYDIELNAYTRGRKPWKVAGNGLSRGVPSDTSAAMMGVRSSF